MGDISPRYYHIPERKVSLTLLECPSERLGCSMKDFMEIIRPTKAKPVRITDFKYVPEGYSIGSLMMENPENFNNALEERVKESKVKTLTATCEKSACSLHIYPDLKIVTGQFDLCYDSRPLLAVPAFIEKFRGLRGDILFYTSYFSEADFDFEEDFKVIEKYMKINKYDFLDMINIKKYSSLFGKIITTTKELVFRKKGKWQ